MHSTVMRSAAGLILMNQANLTSLSEPPDPLQVQLVHFCSGDLNSKSRPAA